MKLISVEIFYFIMYLNGNCEGMSFNCRLCYFLILLTHSKSICWKHLYTNWNWFDHELTKITLHPDRNHTEINPSSANRKCLEHLCAIGMAIGRTGYCSRVYQPTMFPLTLLCLMQRNFCEKDVKDWIRAMCFLSF